MNSIDYHRNRQINSSVQIIQYFSWVLYKILEAFSVQFCLYLCVLCYFETAIYQSQFSFCSIFCPQENTEEALLLLLISESMVRGMCFYIVLSPAL